MERAPTTDTSGPITVGLSLVAALLFTWPLPLQLTGIYGHPLGETDNHLWMFWRALARLAGGGPVANHPEGLALPLMDPVNLPLAAPGFLIDPGLGYSALVFGNVLLGMIAAFWLARQFVGVRAAWVALVAVGCSPFLSGVMEFGITESWPVWPLAAHLAFLWRYARRGGSWDALGAGLCLGAFALSGWYSALFGVIVEIVVLPWLLWRHRRWRGLVGQGLLAALMVLPAFLRFLGMRQLWAGRWHMPQTVPRAHLDHWRWLRNYGTDALNLITPSIEPAPVSLSVYLGLGVLVLAVWGAWRRRRTLAPFALLAGVFVLLALGHWIRIGGDVVTLGGWPVPGPARLLVKAFPPLVGLSHWHRAVGPATVFLGVLAAVGAEGFVSRSTARGLLVAALLLVESLLLGQTRWPRMVYEPEVPAIYEAMAGVEPRGALLELPFDNARQPFSQEAPRLYNRWQVFHGRPVAENYEGPDAVLATNRLAAVADAACGLRPTRPPHELPPQEMRAAAVLEDPQRLRREAIALRADGFTWIVLHRDRARSPMEAAALLARAFGPPLLEVDGAQAWRVEPLRADPTLP